MKIKSYRTTWNATDNIGSFRLHLENNSWTPWYNYTVQEYQAILMLLQNENPVYLRRTNNKVYFHTDIEDTGF